MWEYRSDSGRENEYSQARASKHYRLSNGVVVWPLPVSKRRQRSSGRAEEILAIGESARKERRLNIHVMGAA